jgi:hypothetical protein
MGINAPSLMMSMLVSTIGFGFFIYGKKQERLPQLLAGFVLMTYPYFVENVPWMIGIGGVVMSALAIAVRSGF